MLPRFLNFQSKFFQLNCTDAVKILGLLFISFFVRIYWSKFEIGLSPDGALYLMLARNWTHGQFNLGFWGREVLFEQSFYSILISIFSFIIRNLELTGRVVSILSGSLIIVPVYYLSKKMFSKEVSIVSSILVALYPILIVWSSKILTDILYTALFTAAITLLWYGLNDENKHQCFLAGFFLALGYLTRPIGFINIGIAMLWWLGIILISFKSRVKKLVVLGLLIFVGFMIASSPYITYLRIKTKSWSISQMSGSIMSATEKRRDPLFTEKITGELTEDAKQFKIVTEKSKVGLTEWIRDNPDRFLVKYKGNIVYTFKRSITPILPIPMVVLFFIGLGFGRYNREELVKRVYLLFWLVPSFLVLPALNVLSRYFIPLLPLFLILAGKGIIVISDFIGKIFNRFVRNSKWVSFTRNILMGIGIILVILLLSPYLVKRIARFNPSKITAYHASKDVGFWIRNNLPPNQVIIARAPNVSFYAEGKYVLIPYEEFPRLMEFAHNIGANLIIIDNANISKKRPQLKFLLDENNVPENIELIYKWDKIPKYKTLVYWVLD